MKVAFDCKGTLMTNNEKVLALFKWFEERGCEMYIWSSLYSYTVDTQEMHDIDAVLMSKSYGFDVEDEDRMDIAIDDDRSSEDILAANHFIFVDEIPEPDQFDEFYSQLLE